MKIRLQDGRGMMQISGSLLPLGSESLKTHLFESLGQDVSAMSDSELRDYLNVKPEDYVLVPFRALSATTVRDGAIDFSHNNGKALQDAVEMFNNLVILKNHDMNVDNWIGTTQDAYWDNKTPNVPPGVNFMLKVDTKADPKVARGLVSGALNSGSVTIEFDYAKSHPKMKDEEFAWKLGSTVDGRMVQALVTKITRTYEYSVVWQGADQYAKAIDDSGNIHVPGTQSNSQSLEETLDIKKLAAVLKLEKEAPSDEEVFAAITAFNTQISTANANVITLTAERDTFKTQAETKTAELAAETAKVTTLTAENATLKTEVDGLKVSSASLDAIVKDARSEAIRLYNLVEGDKAQDAMRTMLNSANLEVARSFITSYKERAEAIAPLACAKCGATELSRRSSKQEVPETVKQTKLESRRATASVTSIHD